MVGGRRMRRLREMNFGLLAALIPLDGRPRYIHHGWFLISTANLVVIVAMVVVFALAIVVPFPGGKKPNE
jgi:peptidoglycan/LPS O-acetylase OafA/YrhL